MTSNIVAVSSADPHPNLPPVRGKELDLLDFLTLSAHLIFLGFIPSPRRGRARACPVLDTGVGVKRNVWDNVTRVKSNVRGGVKK